MTAEELHDELEDLGYKAFAELSGIGLNKEGNLIDAPEIFEKIYEDPEKFFRKMDKNVVQNIRTKYDALVKKATEEEYAYFLGTNYNILVKCALRDMSNYNDPLTGYEEEDFIKVRIENMKFFLKETLVRIEKLTPEFELGHNAYILFLNFKQQDDIKRNIKKAIKILKRELTKIKSSTHTILDEKVMFDNKLSKIEKLAYLKESELLSHLTEKNSPNVVAKLLMKFIDFDTDNVGTIERYIKICLNEPYSSQYPKNLEEINSYLSKIKFKKR
jgi:hypothetical protein